MWKDDKQNFVYIPFLKFVQMLEYKCKLVGINVIIHEESYTSKTSFRYQDYIPTYNIDDHNFQPTGKRIERGLFKDKDGTIINADVNGSYNIMRKTLIENANIDTSVEHIKELEDELLKLRIENAFLKELRRLRLEDEAKMRDLHESSTVSEDNSN
jgi:transposase